MTKRVNTLSLLMIPSLATILQCFFDAQTWRVFCMAKDNTCPTNPSALSDYRISHDSEMKELRVICMVKYLPGKSSGPLRWFFYHSFFNAQTWRVFFVWFNNLRPNPSGLSDDSSMFLQWKSWELFVWFNNLRPNPSGLSDYRISDDSETKELRVICMVKYLPGKSSGPLRWFFFHSFFN